MNGNFDERDYFDTRFKAIEDKIQAVKESTNYKLDVIDRKFDAKIRHIKGDIASNDKEIHGNGKGIKDKIQEIENKYLRLISVLPFFFLISIKEIRDIIIKLIFSIL